MLDGMPRIETQAGETLEQRADRDLRLDAGKRHPQAEMRTATKGEMARARPLHIEAVRIGVPRRVAAGCQKRGRDHLRRLHLHSAILKRLQRQPTGLHHRRVVAQYLLDRIEL